MTEVDALAPLRLPAVRSAGTQLRIWDWVGNYPFISMAQTRNATGDFCEEAAKEVFGGQRMTTDGTAGICPDIRLTAHEYLETKSVFLGRSGIVYTHIMDRAARFVACNRVSLSYVFWLHTVRASECPDLFALRRDMAAGIDRVIVVPFPVVNAFVRDRRPQTINYRAATVGKRPATPMDGWRIPFPQLRAWCEGEAVILPQATVYGNRMGTFPIYFA